MKREKNHRKILFTLEKKRARDKLWTKIKTSDGNDKEDISSILKKQIKYYQNLFTFDGCDRDSTEYLTSNLETKLNETDKEMCDKEVSIDEICNAAKLQKPDKSPGDDRISSEFYQLFWYLIEDDFVSVVKDIFRNKRLCESQYRGIITFLFKKGEREDIRNWRPITLLNVDYKIISKILAERLKKVLPKIINTEQKGFAKGRNIFDGNRLLQDIIDYTEIEDEEGAIIFLDQQKAFDRAEWEWIDFVWKNLALVLFLGNGFKCCSKRQKQDIIDYTEIEDEEGAIIFLDQQKTFDRAEWEWIDFCLEKFGFGTVFREWVQMLFKETKTCIHTNGFTLRYVSITRSNVKGVQLHLCYTYCRRSPWGHTFGRIRVLKGLSYHTEVVIQEGGLS